ncbi:MAG: DUF4349 domain-containing protein [Candidatus Woesearchaeota archaeon]
MSLQKQWQTIKENWIIVVLGILLLVVLSGGNAFNIFSNTSSSLQAIDSMYMESTGFAPARGMMYDSGFAPEVQERVLTKQAQIRTQVEHGDFDEAYTAIDTIIQDYIVTSQTVYTQGEDWRATRHAVMSVRVPTTQYDTLIRSLQAIGTMVRFEEQVQDITAQSVDLDTRLAAEQQRLERYQALLESATQSREKMDITDRIFNQEQQIAWLQRSVEQLEQRVDYSTVHITLQEKRNTYDTLALVKLSDLVKNFVGSVNTLLNLLVIIIPWALVVGIIVWVRRKFF